MILLALVSACETAPQATSQACTSCMSWRPPPPPVIDITGTPKDFIANVGDRVFFDAGRTTLRPDARATLTKQAEWLKAYPTYSVIVEGHTDQRGTPEFNLAIGDRRATVVKAFLVGQGLDHRRIKTRSYGKERPVALGANEVAWAQNRRAVIVLE